MSQRVNIEGLLSEVRLRAQGRAHFLIALSGFGGSGKSTLAARLAERLRDTEIIRLDDFIVDRLSVRSQDWDGFDWSRLVVQVLQPISEGADSIEYDIYDWKKNGTNQSKIVALKKYVILEGVGLIRESLKKYFDLTIWLDVPFDIASARGKKRDVEEYGMPRHAELWNTIWTPNDRDYFKKYQPEDNADFLLENKPNSHV